MSVAYDLIEGSEVNILDLNKSCVTAQYPKLSIQKKFRLKTIFLMGFCNLIFT